jgi:hypothetical protein
MSVIVTIRVSADPASFEQHLRDQADAIGRTRELAKRHGAIAHRWYAGDGEMLVADEWPDTESFQSFFAEAPAGDRAVPGGGRHDGAPRGAVLARARHRGRLRLGRLTPLRP